MKRKESYLFSDFRETAAQRFPAQAKQLNAAFDARLNGLLAENADAGKEKLYHLKRQILPGIAAYEMIEGDWIQTCALPIYEGRFTKCGICVLMKELGLYDLTPALFRLDYTMSEAGGVTDFVRQYTLASGGPYCDCGYKKKG